MANQSGTVTNAMGRVTITGSPSDVITFTPTGATFSVEYPIGTVRISGATTTQTMTLGVNTQCVVWVASGTVAWSLADNPDGTAYSSETSVGLQPPGSAVVHTYNPTSAPSQTIKFATMQRFEYATTYSNSGAGHYGASIAWFSLPAGSGNPNYALAAEGKLETAAGTTLTLGTAFDGQLTGAGTVSVFNGVQGRITAHSGTVSYARGHYAQIDSSGTATEWAGYLNAAKSGGVTLTDNYAFKNEDSDAAIYSLGPICDATLQYETPLTGATITMANKISSLLINPAGTIATLTVTFPASPINGQELSISTVQTITALTLGGNGKTILQAITTLAAGNAVVYKYYSGASLWYRQS